MGIVAAPLCGGAKSEKVDRAEVSKALREGYVGIVVATEMAARGLDAPLLTHVINVDSRRHAKHETKEQHGAHEFCEQRHGALMLSRSRISDEEEPI